MLNMFPCMIMENSILFKDSRIWLLLKYFNLISASRNFVYTYDYVKVDVIVYQKILIEV